MTSQRTRAQSSTSGSNSPKVESKPRSSGTIDFNKALLNRDAPSIAASSEEIRFAAERKQAERAQKLARAEA